jgi:hypothetical protein
VDVFVEDVTERTEEVVEVTQALVEDFGESEVAENGRQLWKSGLAFVDSKLEE